MAPAGRESVLGLISEQTAAWNMKLGPFHAMAERCRTPEKRFGMTGGFDIGLDRLEDVEVGRNSMRLALLAPFG